MQSVFLSHGAPTLIFDDCPARACLRDLGDTLVRPRAIVVISAHWETSHIHVLANPQPQTVHDFYGFEQALYEQRYPAPGACALAEDIAQRLARAGMKVTLDRARGLDHGAWIPLSLMYPHADIPVTQISICPALPPLFHWRLGRALASLRDEGVLIAGSGAITHNLGDVRARGWSTSDTATPAYVDEFTDWVAAQIDERDLDALLDWQQAAPHAARAHPSPEHFLPLHVALGAAGVSWAGERVHHSTTYGVIGMDCYLFRSSETSTNRQAAARHTQGD